MKKYFLILFIALIATESQGQKEWTITDCINYALEHHPSIGIEKQSVVISKQNYLEAIGALLPSISAQMGAGLSFGNSRDYVAQAMTATNTFNNQYQVSANLMLFDGLSTIHQLKMNRVNQLRSLNKLQNSKDMLSYEVVEACLNVAYFNETII